MGGMNVSKVISVIVLLWGRIEFSEPTVTVLGVIHKAAHFGAEAFRSLRRTILIVAFYF